MVNQYTFSTRTLFEKLKQMYLLLLYIENSFFLYAASVLEAAICANRQLQSAMRQSGFFYSIRDLTELQVPMLAVVLSRPALITFCQCMLFFTNLSFIALNKVSLLPLW